jgi:hypothetical protein
MNPDMGLNQWLLVTLTAGVGGSLLSVGSAAGVALMGQSKGLYTFGKMLNQFVVSNTGDGANLVLWYSTDLEIFNINTTIISHFWWGPCCSSF